MKKESWCEMNHGLMKALDMSKEMDNVIFILFFNKSAEITWGVLSFFFVLIVLIYIGNKKKESVEKNGLSDLLIDNIQAYKNFKEVRVPDLIESTRSVGKPIAKELEESLSLEYEYQVFSRMQKETNYSNEQIVKLIFEQKRFFLMAKLFKNVPMFSTDVDEVWHQMLMFTRSYQTFCENFAGRMIHHEPNVDGVDPEDARFTFDVMYHLLFKEEDFSTAAWGNLFAKAPTNDFVSHWKESSEDELYKEYFIEELATKEVGRTIIASMKKAIADSEDKDKELEFNNKRSSIQRLRSKRNYKQSEIQSYLTLPYIFWASSASEEMYLSDIGLAKATHSSNNSSGCTAYVNSCNSCNSGGGHHSCGSGGSSCGSSCGGS